MSHLRKKTALRYLLAGLAALALACTPKVIPDDKPEEQIPQETSKSDFPVDVVKAFQGAGIISNLKSSNNYSPHSGIDVTEVRYTDVSANPQAVFVMQVDLSDPTVSMTNTVPNGRERLSVQFKRIDAPGAMVMGGVNTDFFITTGDNAGESQGVLWHGGKCIKNTFNSQKTRPRSFVYWDDNENVNIAASADYAAVKSSLTLKEVFSGGQFLVRNGLMASITEDSVYGVHPRTMIGVQANKKRVILVVLDGRNETHAVGMNYPDMQRIMLSLKCRDAINLDGGGSSTFVVRDYRPSAFGYGFNATFLIKNSPSDGSERAIGPGLAFLASD